MARLDFFPPVLNSAGPWATTGGQLKDLLRHPSTGAITTRTCTLNGFPEDIEKHKYQLFDVIPTTETPSWSTKTAACTTETAVGSLNSLGYSPLALWQTLQDLERITRAIETPNPKTIIVSITGPTEELRECISQIALAQKSIRNPLCVEINLSCPNIPGKPPPAFSVEGLVEYFTCLRDCSRDEAASKLRFGIKVPPYPNPENIAFLKQALLSFASYFTSRLPLAFITATNTLGGALMFDYDGAPVLDAEDDSFAIETTANTLAKIVDDGDPLDMVFTKKYQYPIGAMAGAPLHAVSLGTVYSIRRMLDSEWTLHHIQIIGVGGVNDLQGANRMRRAGADFVGIGSALIQHGPEVFDNIKQKDWVSIPDVY